MKKIFLMLLLSLGFGMAASAQSYSILIEGCVTDEKTKEPLIGVTVIIKGTTIGTITDIDGKYEIICDRESILEYSYIGYKTEIRPVKGKRYINVEMKEDAEILEEIKDLHEIPDRSDIGWRGGVSVSQSESQDFE